MPSNLDIHQSQWPNQTDETRHARPTPVLKSLELENFKGIASPVRLEFSPITLLFGANSSGKSTLLQALLYLREILERNNPDADRIEVGGDLVDLGGFRNLVHRHDPDNRVRLKAELNVKELLFPKYVSEHLWPSEDGSLDLDAEAESCAVEIEIAWSSLLQKPLVSAYRTWINGVIVGTIRASSDGKDVFLTDLNCQHPLFYSSDDRENMAEWRDERLGKAQILDQYMALPPQESEPPRPLFAQWLEEFELVPQGESPARRNSLPGHSSALPQWGKALPLDLSDSREHLLQDCGPEASQIMTVVSILSQAIIGPGELLKNALREIIHLGPLRAVPERSYIPPRTMDRARWAAGLGAWDLLHESSPEFLEKASDWLSSDLRLATGYSLQRKRFKKLDMDSELYIALQDGRALEDFDNLQVKFDLIPEETELLLREETTQIAVAPFDVGVGISQVLPVVVAALQDEAALVSIEQPELHIHPAIQVRLGDLFLSSIQKRKRMFLIETHSEHLMLRLLRRVRETYADELPPDAPPASLTDIAVIYVEQDETGVGLTPLPIDREGEFAAHWPQGFFDERAEELF